MHNEAKVSIKSRDTYKLLFIKWNFAFRLVHGYDHRYLYNSPNMIFIHNVLK